MLNHPGVMNKMEDSLCLGNVPFTLEWFRSALRINLKYNCTE